MPAIRRIFIDWTQPALPMAARWLLQQVAGNGGDLSGVVVVVPGRGAGRRLLEILVQECDARGLGLSPPQIVTMGTLPELLYSPRLPFADELTQRLAWVQGLHQIPREDLAEVIPALPSRDDLPRWLELADMLRAQHTELAADNLDFQKVADHTAHAGELRESRRWQALAKIQRKYLDVLDGLELWDKQTARLEAIKRREPRTEKRIVLLGTVDMNRTARQMLDQVAASVTALIFAPEELAAHFDAHGCLEPATWAQRQLPVADERIVVADDPLDQADEVARAIASFDSQYRGDEITIGVCDEQIVPQIQRQLHECGLTARWGPGKVLAETGPYRLLAAVTDFLERSRYQEYAALVRHPDIDRWLLAKGLRGDWLTRLDEYQACHVQTRVGEVWLGEPDEWQPVKAVHDAISQLTAAVAGPPLPLSDWARVITQLLLEVYSQRKYNRIDAADRNTLAALEAIHAALLAQAEVPAALAPAITAVTAIRWALESIGQETVPPPADPAAIELVGWLELALDDAPAVIVTTLNEGHVPKLAGADMFLPDSLRSPLGLDDNARRYARDAYALSVLLASRQPRLIVGRRDADGYPLAPSRLLLACDDETLARRVQRFFSAPPPRHHKQPLAGTLSATRDAFTFAVPRPALAPQAISKLSVTRFRDYIACPYRFYLKHVAKAAESIDDGVDELDGGAFGHLAHEVLNQFGLDPRRHTTSIEEITALLDEFLHDVTRAYFGSHPRPAVAVQIEQLRRRLHAFAWLQRQRSEEGWRIVHSEAAISEATCILDVDGQPFFLTGRIDRIDQHEATGAWAIWDYKTGDTLSKPDRTHRKRDEWVDLQLPLYRYLAAHVDPGVKSILDVDGQIQLGYVQLPKSVADVGFDLAPWAADDLHAADERAREVIRGLRKQIFGPPKYPPPDFSEDLAGICMDNVFGRPEFLYEVPNHK